jgi:hypothetical protein
MNKIKDYQKAFEDARKKNLNAKHLGNKEEIGIYEYTLDLNADLSAEEIIDINAYSSGIRKFIDEGDQGKIEDNPWENAKIKH